MSDVQRVRIALALTMLAGFCFGRAYSLFLESRRQQEFTHASLTDYRPVTAPVIAPGEPLDVIQHPDHDAP